MSDKAMTASESGTKKVNPTAWVDAHGDALFRFAMARVRDRDAAEELVQETFTAALVGKDRYSGAASERTWLIGIMKYKVVDHFRRRQRETAAPAESGDDPVLDPMFRNDGHWKAGPGQWELNPSELLERAEFWRVFEDCLEGLPERAAQAFMLRVLDDTEADLVCQALAITPTNLWALLHRARGRLRRCLEVKWFAGDREQS
jgi:RNA polymerase sigma-70 factor (ECF subfamily)